MAAKSAAPGDRPVDMRLGGEVDHGVVTGKYGPEQRGVADVALDELEPRAAGDGLEVSQVSRVGQLVQYGDAGLAEARVAAGQERAYVVRADEACSAGYQDPHELICTLL